MTQRNALDGPDHPIIAHHQGLRIQRFSRPSQASAPAETIGDRIALLERQVATLIDEVKQLREGSA
jgi:hypothetical protein